ncbi:hypothetical protein KXV92_006042, partial [Aspergillus fumigatus]
MFSTRPGKSISQSPSGIQKNISARKNPENPSVAALRKSIQTKRKQRREGPSARESVASAKEKLLALEKDIMKADNDLMDIDEGHNPTEEGTLFIPPQCADKNETLLKTENVEGPIGHAEASKSTNPTPTPASIMNPVKKGHGRSHVGHSGDDKFDDMLVRLESLPTVDHSGGVGDAWFRARRSIRMIVRCGPPHAAKYVFQPGHISLTRGLQEVSNAESRLCNIMTTDDKGERRRRYGAENIVGIAGVAISAEGTYLKLIWTGIDKEHQHL